MEAIAPITTSMNVVFPPRYNIAPTQNVLALRLDKDDQRILSLVHWGLIPSWVKDASVGNRMINARAESAAEKPAFRNALAKRRCLIPADGFYEWKKTGTHKQPMFIHRRDDGLFCFAGLWERWHNPTGQDIDSMANCDWGNRECPTHNRLASTMVKRIPSVDAQRFDGTPANPTATTTTNENWCDNFIWREYQPRVCGRANQYGNDEQAWLYNDDCDNSAQVQKAVQASIKRPAMGDCCYFHRGRCGQPLMTT